MEHVAEQPLLRHERQNRRPQCQRRYRRQAFQILQLDPGAPDDAATGCGQNRSEGKRRCRFDSTVAIGVAFVGRILAVMGSKKNQEVTNKVLERV